MKNNGKAIVHLPGMPGKGPRTMYASFTVSVICHLLFLTVLIFVPGLKIPKRTSHSVIHVNMVARPAKGTPAGTRYRAVLKKSAAKTKKTSEGVSLKTVSAAPKKKAKSINKKPVTHSKSTIEELKNEAEASRPGDVTDAIERIKNQVNETDARRRSVENSDKELAGVEDGVAGGSGTGAGLSVDILTLYTYEIKDLVQQNWAYSEQLADAKSDLQTFLVFEVLPNGEIRDIWFTEKSGNRYLDESAYKAVIKSKPFPPHPVELSRPVVEVPLRFSPEGLLD
ncbi:MAG: TonB C-terminal domain-containing protein [Deltaproteobacteria bacterium]|nr:TonB C-terminal domain-containing protein [Deltaproteobacteria bacterium]MBW1847276.1 TonB C-terminal domain-containing protein [Deltaproteobacteria bacterium]MBW1985105.1 TonB C-terminal domain-containing protein [Deltaproteobacteria bacterium]MBW2179909.1 TonB C-terminal domain-containing protein [Deltaproteobacteria bacterium]MBW2364830.1 TonB C-terminal domain-containing protein [Deltaproteobacteria bacterium]